MMSVVINDRDPANLALKLEPAVGILKSVEGLNDLVELNVQLQCNRCRRERVIHVVLTRHGQLHFSELLTSPHDRKLRSKAVVTNMSRRHLRLRGKTIRHTPALDAGHHQLNVW